VQPRAPEGRRVGGQGGQHRRVSRPDLLQEQSVHHPGRFHEAGERLAFARGQLRDRRRDVGRREPRRHPSQFLQPRPPSRRLHAVRSPDVLPKPE